MPPASSAGNGREIAGDTGELVGTGAAGSAAGGDSEGQGEVQPSGDEQSRQHARAPGPVLIVEDEAPIAEALAMIVEDAGYTTMMAAHGKTALEQAHLERPSLVFTDLMMPHMNGQDLIAALRETAAAQGYAPPPIVVMTAASSLRAQAVGADALLRKPFNLSEVEALLLRFLGPPA